VTSGRALLCSLVPMWWNVGPHLYRRQLEESGGGGGLGKRRACSFFESESNTEELGQILRSKYGTVTRAWRVALDTDDSGVLDFREFSSALAGIGYVGNIRTLWFSLDSKMSGNITLRDLDERAYHQLEKFRVLAARHSGGVVNCWHQLLDADKSGTVSFPEFHEACQVLGYEDEEEELELFGYLLTTPGTRSITKHDVQFLQTWEEQKQITANRNRLPKSWVNVDPYFIPSKGGSVMTGLTANPSTTTLGSEGVPAPRFFPSHNRVQMGNGHMPGRHEESGVEDFGAIVAEDEEKTKDVFRQFLKDKYGTLSKAFDAMDANGSGSLSMVEFQAVVATVLRFCRPSAAGRLFLSFNKDPGAMLSWDELGITRSEWVSHTMERQIARRQHKAGRREVLLARGMLGSSPRQLKSYTCHSARLRNEDKPKDVAFGNPLPTGWGFPPYFDPARDNVKLPPLSAR